MTIAERRTGWLDERSHARIRELLLHTMSRYHLLCPTYCAMPDHLHLLWMGLTGDADQLVAAACFRKHLNEILNPCRLQKQGYDHVLREQERARGALDAVAFYILENPVRAGLVPMASAYPYSGCMVPGYPALSVGAREYWTTFWKIYEKLRE